jgi:hypothetical protein
MQSVLFSPDYIAWPTVHLEDGGDILPRNLEYFTELNGITTRISYSLLYLIYLCFLNFALSFLACFPPELIRTMDLIDSS